MVRAKKEAAAEFAFADPANPTLHELNLYTQSLLTASPASAAEAAAEAPAPAAGETPTE